ncbi:hypothetical protein EGW08_012901 [Elysia chlorotica]|uniref:SOCS box domain-containing protein n=1 Tax=Elysia chlorotica TaxID=188477 RepID=A0A433TCM1_ELYCH|nr:hypothetical protein EGW08_012901 [Elysia chlorotica]
MDLNVYGKRNSIGHRLVTQSNTIKAEDVVNNNSSSSNSNNNNSGSSCNNRNNDNGSEPANFSEVTATSGSHDSKPSHIHGRYQRISTCDFLEMRDRVQGSTALHVACAYNNDKAALALLRLGANPNPLNLQGDTPLAKLLQPVTRKADDCHNRSRLVLARRLVAMGMVVERKEARDCDKKIGTGSGGTCGLGSGSGMVTSGFGSAKVRQGPGNGKTISAHENGASDFEESILNMNDSETESIFYEVQAENVDDESDLDLPRANDYSQNLGLTSRGKRDNSGAVGFYDCPISLSSARDRRVGSFRVDTDVEHVEVLDNTVLQSGKTVGEISMHTTFHTSPQYREDLEAQLEALCVFQVEDYPQPDMEGPSSPLYKKLMPDEYPRQTSSPYKSPTQKSTTDKSTTQKSTTEKSTTQKSTTYKSLTQKYERDKSPTQKSTTDKSPTQKSTTDNPLIHGTLPPSGSSQKKVKTDKFRFPSRDERIRLRFKRLLGELSASLTLQQLCRLAILRSLTGKSVAGSVDKLGLPVLMQKFLLRDDLF